MSQNDTEVQRMALEKDQLRLKDLYSKLYSKQGPAMTKQMTEIGKRSPEYKKYHRKSLGLSSVAGAGVGALSGAITAKGKLVPIAAGLGALMGLGGGELRSRSKLKHGAKAAVQKSVIDSMASEAKKNVLIHSYLAQPGVQQLIVKRPWGTERYEG